MEITDAIRDYATDRITSELGEFSRIERVHAILDLEKYRHKVEVVVQAKNHIKVDAHAESEDMYVSIDQAIEKAEKQLRRLRDKIQDHKSREKLAHVDLRMGSVEEGVDEETA
jgi:putative sigma-54 modulation protein